MYKPGLVWERVKCRNLKEEDLNFFPLPGSCNKDNELLSVTVKSDRPISSSRCFTRNQSSWTTLSRFTCG